MSNHLVLSPSLLISFEHILIFLYPASVVEPKTAHRGPTNTEYNETVTPLDARMWLTFLAARTYCWLTLNLASSKITRCFSAEPCSSLSFLHYTTSILHHSRCKIWHFVLLRLHIRDDCPVLQSLKFSSRPLCPEGNQWLLLVQYCGQTYFLSILSLCLGQWWKQWK